MGRLKSKRIAMVLGGLTTGLLAILVIQPWVFKVKGADHRESPVVNEDPAVDMTDFFAFINTADPTRVVFAMGVNSHIPPALNTSYAFSPGVLYQFKIDNDGDAREDLVIQARFEGFESGRDPRCPASTAAGGQYVTVRGPAQPTMTGATNVELPASAPTVTGCSNTVLGTTAGVRVFAGLRDDPFVFDFGQFFRILAGRQDFFREVTMPGLYSARGRSVRADGSSGVDGAAGFNVSALVVDVPKSMVQSAAARTGTYLSNSTTIGTWGTTSRAATTTRDSSQAPVSTGSFVQLERAAQPVVKTVFVTAGPPRDVFNRAVPENDLRDFSNLIPDTLTTTDNDGTNNTIAGRAAVLNALGLTSLPNGAPLLLPATFVNTDRDFVRKVVLPDVLRVDLARAANDLGIGSNGYQSGRRPADDVIDIVLGLARQLLDVKFPAASGVSGSGPLGTRAALDCSTYPCPDRRIFVVLQGTKFAKPNALIGDPSQNGNDKAFLTDCPFFAPPHPFPGEAGTIGFPTQQ